MQFKNLLPLTHRIFQSLPYQFNLAGPGTAPYVRALDQFKPCVGLNGTPHSAETAKVWKVQKCLKT
ncbi:MAG: hypothetical protein DMG05_19190 [Acidobacteria bacterium]|nr:MAG: hypothetical protein DMG05_19190 [Acidobacteriota bacterium]